MSGQFKDRSPDKSILFNFVRDGNCFDVLVKPEGIQIKQHLGYDAGYHSISADIVLTEMDIENILREIKSLPKRHGGKDEMA